MKSYGITLLRLTVGAIYLMHAYRLLVITTPAGVARFVESAFALPYPGAIAWLVIAVHGLGGLALMAGILTRPAAAANGLLTLVTLVRIHVPQGFFLRGAERAVLGYEYVLLLGVATIALLLLGSGPVALRPSK
ncbi:MAG TPA: DoxX family protein [Methylomirabilota bacterium]|jgi:putative oxidoreductase|nr:DoxX family protein [Methylomirabilota bacterium]